MGGGWRGGEGGGGGAGGGPAGRPRKRGRRPGGFIPAASHLTTLSLPLSLSPSLSLSARPRRPTPTLPPPAPITATTTTAYGLPLLDWVTPADPAPAFTVTGLNATSSFRFDGGPWATGASVRRRGTTSLGWPKPKLRLSFPKGQGLAVWEGDDTKAHALVRAEREAKKGGGGGRRVATRARARPPRLCFSLSAPLRLTSPLPSLPFLTGHQLPVRRGDGLPLHLRAGGGRLRRVRPGGRARPAHPPRRPRPERN